MNFAGQVPEWSDTEVPAVEVPGDLPVINRLVLGLLFFHHYFLHLLGPVVGECGPLEVVRGVPYTYSASRYFFFFFFFFTRMFYQLLRVQHSCSSTQSWGSVLPSIVERREQNSRGCPLFFSNRNLGSFCA